MDKMDLAMYEAFEKLLHEDGHLVKTDIFAFRLGWRECQAAQQSVEPTVDGDAVMLAILSDDEDYEPE